MKSRSPNRAAASHSSPEEGTRDLAALRTLPVDLETVVEIATETEDCLDQCYERTGYVDTRTGEVHIIYCDAFRCVEGELEPDQLEDWTADGIELAGRILADTEERYVEIERWHSSDAYNLMAEFAEKARDPRVRDRLLAALRGSKPFRRFKDALFEWPAVREAWFAFQGHAQRECARDWLRGLGIDATDASTYKLPPAPEHW